MSRFIGVSRHLVLAALALGSPTATAQSIPEIPKIPGPGVAPGLPQPRPVPTPLLPTAIDTLTNAPPRVFPPMPGSVADVYAQELEAREALTTNTPEGNVFRFLPSTLLWDPPLAVKRDPRMQLLASNLGNDRSSYALDTSIGGTLGLFRYDLLGRDASVQLDIFGVVISRFAGSDLVANDYRFGVPLTWRRGWWSGKIAYEHTSSYSGERDTTALGFDSGRYGKEELVLGLSRVLYEQLQIYGHVAYAFGFVVPGVESTTENRSRADIGFEWYDRRPTGFRGTPFVAGNAEWRGDESGKTNLTLQAGWLWKNPYQRFGTARVFVEHYRGQSPFGQLLLNRETFTSVGFGFDY